MIECNVCGIETEDYFECEDCGEPTCFSCGDGDMCNKCIGDEVFLANVLDSEGEM